MPAFFGLINGSDAVNIQKRKIHEIMTLVINGKMTYSDAYNLPLSERKYIIDLLQKSNQKEKQQAAKVNSNSSGKKIKRIGIS